MNTQIKSTKVSIFAALSQKVTDYKLLLKLRLSLTVVFSSVMAYLIAWNQAIDWVALGKLSLGGFLVTGAANTLNQVLEKDYDRLMKRTADRPLATGRMSVSEAVLAAGLMSLVGVTLLALFNPLTAFLGMVAMLSYAFVYTPMKRISPISVLIGAFPGALPTMIGCVAAQNGQLTWLSFVLFAIQFLWQFPHFWAIGWLGFEDYENAGFKMLPNNTKNENVGWQSFLYASTMIPISVIPFLMGYTGEVSAFIAVLASTVFTYFGWNLYKKCDRKAALMLMFSSFFYLPIVLVAYYLDKV